MLPSLAMINKYPPPLCLQCRQNEPSVKGKNELTGIPIYWNLCNKCHNANLPDDTYYVQHAIDLYRMFGGPNNDGIKNEAEIPKCAIKGCKRIKHVDHATSSLPIRLVIDNLCYKCGLLYKYRERFDMPSNSSSGEYRHQSVAGDYYNLQYGLDNNRYSSVSNYVMKR